MIIFLYGPDDYRRSQKKQEIIAEFTKKRTDTALRAFDLEEKGEIEALEEFLRNQSIFGAAKLAVLENAFEIPADALAKIIKPILNEKGLQVLISEKDKPLKAVNFLIEKPALFQKFEHLTGAEWIAFIMAEARKQKITLAEPAARFLGTVYEGNSWGLVTELEKLGSMKSSINKKDLDGMDLEAAPNYWALINGLKSYDVKNRLYAFEKMLALNDAPAKIFNILASQWKEKTPHMAIYDLAIKSGKLDYEEALVDLLIS